MCRFGWGVLLPESTEGSRGSPQIIDACFVFVIERSVVVFSDLLKGKRIFLDAGFAIVTRDSTSARATFRVVLFF